MNCEQLLTTNGMATNRRAGPAMAPMAANLDHPFGQTLRCKRIEINAGEALERLVTERARRPDMLRKSACVQARNGGAA